MTSPADRVAKALAAQVAAPPTAPLRHPVAFLLASTEIGPLIVSRLDYCMAGPNQAYGVGYELLETGTYAAPELKILTQLLDLRKKHHGSGVVMFDCGANIGVHTLTTAKHMRDWGSVVAIEAQERLFYALAGNVALNNCYNVRCLHAAVGPESGAMHIPQMNFELPGSYGSFECKRGTRPDTGQNLNYEKTVEVQVLALDALNLPRLDLLKIDVEGMELDVLDGAYETIKRYSPIIIAEHIKCSRTVLERSLEARDYDLALIGMNIVAVHSEDPCCQEFFSTVLTQS